MNDEILNLKEAVQPESPMGSLSRKLSWRGRPNRGQRSPEGMWACRWNTRTRKPIVSTERSMKTFTIGELLEKVRCGEDLRLSADQYKRFASFELLISDLQVGRLPSEDERELIITILKSFPLPPQSGAPVTHPDLRGKTEEASRWKSEPRSKGVKQIKFQRKRRNRYLGRCGSG
jgi:hypothetical protein